MAEKNKFSNFETERHALPCSQLNYSLSYRVRGARLSLAGLPCLHSCAHLTEIGPAHGPGPPGAGAVNTVKH